MNNTLYFQLIAVDSKNNRVRVINEDRDYDYLSRISDARGGIAWIDNKCCDLQVVMKK